MNATTLRIIPYSLYAGDSLAAYFSRQYRRGLAFVGGRGHLARFRRVAPGEQTYAVSYWDHPFTRSRHFIPGGLTPYIKVISGEEEFHGNRRPTEQMAQSVKRNLLVCIIPLLLFLGILVGIYIQAVHRTPYALSVWSQASPLWIVCILALLVPLVDNATSLRWMDKPPAPGRGRKWPFWIASSVPLLLILGLLGLYSATEDTIPEQAAEVCEIVSELRQETLSTSRSLSLLDRAIFTASGSMLRLEYYDSPMTGAYLSAWEHSCTGGQPIETDSFALACKTAPTIYTAAFPMDGQIWFLYRYEGDQAEFLELVSAICEALS